MADFVVKQGDKGLVITGAFVDSAGAAINLTGGSVTVAIRQMTALAPLTTATATITGASAGLVSYTLTATDTALAGQYMVEFHATVSSNTYTAPTAGYYELTVEENLTTAGGQRLLGLGEVKDYLNIPAADRSQDAELIRFIDAMTPVVEFITGPVLQRIYQDEIYDGGNGVISLRHQPVLAVHSVTEYRGPVAYPLTQIQTIDQGTIYSYMFHEPATIVRRTVGGGQTTFPPGLGTVIVNYTAGLPVVPSNVRTGTLELIRVNFQRTQQSGRPNFGGSGSGGDDSVSGTVAMGYFIPNRVRELLQPKKRFPRFS